MPIYIRKSVKAGPFRFNLSKSGIGLSVGIRGLRIGSGPKGHYVHAGRNGLYYTASLKPSKSPAKRPRSPSRRQVDIARHTGVDMVEVESGDVLAMRDEKLSDVLAELNRKSKSFRFSLIIFFSMLLCSGITFVYGYYELSLYSSALSLFGFLFGKWLDSYKRATVVVYDLDPQIAAAYEEVVKAFDVLAECNGKWHIEAGGAVKDLTTWKRNAGASHIVKRVSTELRYRLPANLKCNVTPPSMKVGRQVLYFLPDVTIIEDGHSYGMINYRDLRMRCQISNFVEDGRVPKDATITGYTWEHPNRDGGPDRRFRTNRQLPVCRYEAIHFSSDSGLNELVEFSRYDISNSFVRSLSRLPNKIRPPGSIPQLTQMLD